MKTPPNDLLKSSRHDFKSTFHDHCSPPQFMQFGVTHFVSFLFERLRLAYGSTCWMAHSAMQAHFSFSTRIFHPKDRRSWSFDGTVASWPKLAVVHTGILMNPFYYLRRLSSPNRQEQSKIWDAPATRTVPSYLARTAG